MGRVEELISSLSRYAHLLGFPVDLEWVRFIEEIQEKIMEEVRGEVLSYGSLRDLVLALDARGYLRRASLEVAGLIGEEIEDYDKAFKAALTGDLSVRGSRAVLITLQAIARAYAEELLKKGVTVEVSAYCPVCGALSETMFKEGGSYYMVCHFCSYKWLVSEAKPVCPYCGNSDELSIGLMSDKQMRVALIKCWECGSSWRAILDETIKVPLILKPLIAMAAERFRQALREVEERARESGSEVGGA